MLGVPLLCHRSKSEPRKRFSEIRTFLAILCLKTPEYEGQVTALVIATFQIEPSTCYQSRLLQKPGRLICGGWGTFTMRNCFITLVGSCHASAITSWTCGPLFWEMPTPAREHILLGMATSQPRFCTRIKRLVQVQGLSENRASHR